MFMHASSTSFTATAASLFGYRGYSYFGYPRAVEDGA
jgi:hypothetical protein